MDLLRPRVDRSSLHQSEDAFREAELVRRLLHRMLIRRVRFAKWLGVCSPAHRLIAPTRCLLLGHGEEAGREEAQGGPEAADGNAEPEGAESIPEAGQYATRPWIEWHPIGLACEHFVPPAVSLTVWAPSPRISMPLPPRSRGPSLSRV